MFTIVIGDDEGHVRKMQFESLTMDWERGTLFDAEGRIVPGGNGQQRLTLRAWSGCQSHDDFRPETGRR